jgi:hypothetical protein
MQLRRKVQTTVKSATGGLLTGITYRMINPRSGLRAASNTFGYIHSGLRERGFTGEYIDKVKKIAVANNPTIAGEIKALWPRETLVELSQAILSP